MHDIRLRPATPADIELLSYWDTQPHVVASTGDDEVADWAEDIALADDTWEIWIAEEDGRPVGVVQVIDPARERTHYWGDCDEGLRAIDIWIGEEADLGRGIGTQMMRQVLDASFADPQVTAVLIDPLAANVRAQAFYARLGFADVGPRRFGTDDCLVMRLERKAWRAVPR